MKPILIQCGALEGAPLAPDWLGRGRFRKYASPEDFLKSDLGALGPDSVLFLSGPRVLHGVRLLRRFPGTALACIAAPGGDQIPGVDAAISRQDEVEAAARRVRAAAEALEPIDLDKDLGDLSVLLFLRFLFTRGIHSLEAKNDPASPYGYLYPLCGIFFNDALETWPQDLVRMGFLSRRFHDLVHVCPQCDRCQLNFREVCPECSSANVGVGEVLHHFRCGQVAAESAFRRGGDLFCQKCQRQLRHLGVDYDRPSEFYSCRACPAVFSEVQNDALCLSCGKNWQLPELREHVVHDYQLAEEGSRAAREGMLPTGTVEALFDREFGELYTPEFFSEFAKIEMRRRKRYGGSVAVLGLLLDLPEERTLTLKKAHQMAWTVGRVLRENLRDSDLMARFSDRLYLGLLTDTSRETSPVVAGRLQKAANDSLSSLGVRLLVADLTSSVLAQLEKGPLDVQALSQECGGQGATSPPPGGEAKT